MSGEPDPRVATVCYAENRAILTLDLDFADIRTYPPGESVGIVGEWERFHVILSSITIAASTTTGDRVSATIEDASLRDLLSRVAAGTPKCVFADAVDAALSALELSANRPNAQRFVVLRWLRPPRIDDAIKVVLHEIASVARSTWPAWFGLSSSADLPDRDRLVKSAKQANLSPNWIREAWLDCQQHRLPLPPGYSQVVTVKHLVRAIADDDLSILVVVDAAHRRDIRVDGICRLTQWLATNTDARCSLLLDASLAGSPELASVDFEPSFWSSDGEVKVRSQTADSGENKARVWPVIGQPHPLSPGEQLLYRSLQLDPLHADRFAFNHPVTTWHGNTYIVDLMAADVKVIVEVDGYTHHGNRVAFHIDRQRDYELHTSGYLVLRLPHDDIIEDVDLCLKKIRHFLDFRQKHPSTA